MLVIDSGNYPTSGRSASVKHNPILDSPTLARVERAMLRHEGGAGRRDTSYMQRMAQTQSLLPPSYTKSDEFDTIKKGLLWQQRDKIFSRWKERYFILTRDYLHCFRRASGADKISEMGQFLFKIKLVDVDKVEWENKKNYSAVSITFPGHGRIFLRTTLDLEDWFEFLEECVQNCKESKEKRRAVTMTFDKNHHRENNNDRYLMDWLGDRHRHQNSQPPTDTLSTTNDTVQRRHPRGHHRHYENSTLDHRLSLLTDIDISTYNDTLETRSVTSYRMNKDVLCIQPLSIRNNMANDGHTQPNDTTTRIASQLMKIRERSYSDIQRLDRGNWHYKYSNE